MKKFHKRAAVFLTAATLAGLPAGAFFYSSPGSLTAVSYTHLTLPTKLEV